MLKPIFRNRFINVFNGNSPILLEMPHSGQLGIRTIDEAPRVIGSKVRFESREVRKTIGFGCDSAVPAMSGFYNLIQELDLSGICNDLARFYCDTNRDRYEASGWALEGNDCGKSDHGIIWARTLLTGVDLSLPAEELEDIVRQRCERTLRAPLTLDEFDNFTKEVYDPYRAMIGYIHSAIIDRHGYCIHLALHSLPPLSVTTVNGGYVCGEKASRGVFDSARNTLPDVILIHNDYKAADRIFVNKIRNVMIEGGLIVEDGRGPFVGSNGVTKMYGNPMAGVHVIGIEHVTHDIEPERHLGIPIVDMKNATSLQPIYKKAVTSLLI